MSRLQLIAALWVSACSAPGPGDGGTGGAGGGDAVSCSDAGYPTVVACDGGETFKAAQTAMLAGCGGGGLFSCHDPAPYQGNLDLSPAHQYTSLVGVPATYAPAKPRVRPCDVLGSFLVQKLTDTQNTDAGEREPMPKGEAIQWRPPDPERLRVLECWIQRGAPND
jgi:hypothetical protein